MSSHKLLVSATGDDWSNSILTNNTRDGTTTVFAEELTKFEYPSPSSEDNNSNKAEKSADHEIPNTIVSIYLNSESKEMLKVRFPGMFSNERYTSYRALRPESV